MSSGKPDGEGGNRAERGAAELSLFLAGDTLITEAWSHVQDPAFARLVAEMRAADVRLVNLETVILEFEGYAQADSGGSYAASPPAVARELKWADVDLLAHANNHAFDHGSEGFLSTHTRVALAFTFVRHGRASRSRPDIRGRPGLNPLELAQKHGLELT